MNEEFDEDEVFDESSAEQIVREFLIEKYPANQGVFSKRLVRRGLAALKRQHEGLEIGALEREFSD